MPNTRWTSPRYWPTWLALALLRVTSWLPLPLLALLGRTLGQLLYYLHAGRRRVVHINLEKCLPHWDLRRRRQLARRHFRALGQGLFDTALAWWASPRRVRRLVRFVGQEHYEQALAQNRPIILLTCHCVALELGGRSLLPKGPLVILYKRTKNPVFGHVLYAARAHYGLRQVEFDEGLKPVIRALKQGYRFYYLPDQDLGSHADVFAPFFGVPTATVSVLGRLATVSRAMIVPCFTRQLPGGRGYEVLFRPALTEIPSGDALRDATRMNQIIEQWVEAMPEQYFWVHKRFKTRPGGERSVY